MKESIGGALPRRLATWTGGAGSGGASTNGDGGEVGGMVVYSTLGLGTGVGTRVSCAPPCELPPVVV